MAKGKRVTSESRSASIWGGVERELFVSQVYGLQTQIYTVVALYE